MATTATVDYCPVCHATRAEVQSKGHRSMGRIGHEYTCPEACTCVPQHLTLAEHRTRLTDDDTASGPQSCYPEEIATLREMIADERERIDMLGDEPLTASRAYSMAVSQRRIDALQTAIDALGGAL